jgi:hypothetical protein
MFNSFIALKSIRKLVEGLIHRFKYEGFYQICRFDRNIFNTNKRLLPYNRQIMDDRCPEPDFGKA